MAKFKYNKSRIVKIQSISFMITTYILAAYLTNGVNPI